MKVIIMSIFLFISIGVLGGCCSDDVCNVGDSFAVSNTCNKCNTCTSCSTCSTCGYDASYSYSGWY